MAKAGVCPGALAFQPLISSTEGPVGRAIDETEEDDDELCTGSDEELCAGAEEDDSATLEVLAGGATLELDVSSLFPPQAVSATAAASKHRLARLGVKERGFRDIMTSAVIV